MKIYLYLYICVVFVNACRQHQTCSSCIRDSEACVWCASESISEQRCIPKESKRDDWCTGEIQDPSSKINDIFINETDVQQIKPQRIQMDLRPGQTINFNFSYTPAQDYPVDLYFLFDAAMRLDWWTTQKEQTKRVVEWMRTLTNNASIGFGTFVDKNALPFASIKNESLSYSFKHQLKISNDPEHFQKALKEVEIVDSIFIDNVHGGFDALAQAIVCKDIGWRNMSRKVIVLLSDNLYHAVGDGKAAGIVNPYDGRCYMKNGVYENEMEMDYPSLKMINKLASDRNVLIFFASDTVKDKYDSLVEVITEAHVIPARKARSDKESIASKLKTTYESITNIIKLKKDINPNYKDYIKIEFDPDCDKVICKVEQTKMLNFSVNITVLEYFQADDIKVAISVIGIQEKLTLDIGIVNECKCRPGDDTLCKGGGKRECGVCKCYRNRTGKNCECSMISTPAHINRSTCVMPGKIIECNGRGTCICGSCVCGEKRYRGQFCECDNEFCPKDKNGKFCGNGYCQCGKCVCDQGWLKNSQSTCNCEASSSRCQTGKHVCSDYGRCECNKCKCTLPICDWDARPVQGPRCNPLPCPDCHVQQCLLLEPYALSGSSDTPCTKRVNVTTVTKLDNESSWRLCSNVRSKVGCYTKFIYKYDDEKYGIHLIVQSENDCAESYYIYGGACFGSLILIGIVTLMGWKVLTTYRDRKECRQFLLQHQASMKKAQPKTNPLFSAANTTVTNPIYPNLSSLTSNP